MTMTDIQKEKIFRDYYDKVYGHIFSKVSNRRDAEDLAGDVFAKIYSKLDTFDKSKAALSTWIYKFGYVFPAFDGSERPARTLFGVFHRNIHWHEPNIQRLSRSKMARLQRICAPPSVTALEPCQFCQTSTAAVEKSPDQWYYINK